MRQSSRISLAIFTIIYLMTVNGCGSSSPKGRKAPGQGSLDNWLIHGQVANGGFAGGEILALGLDGMRYRSLIAPDNSFALQLPGNASYAVYFLESERTRYTEDNFAGITNLTDYTGRGAVLNYEESADIGVRDTLRLPKVLFGNNISLGQVDIKNGQAFPTINPALILDFDSDGINDFADADDQNDGLSDREQLKATERIEICHFNEQDQGKSITVPLAELLDHVQDGDSLGPCISSRQTHSSAPLAADRAPKPIIPPSPGPAIPPKAIPQPNTPAPTPSEQDANDSSDEDEADEEDNENDEGEEDDTEEDEDKDSDKDGDKKGDDKDEDEDEDEDEDKDEDEDEEDDADKEDGGKKKHRKKPHNTPKKPARAKLRFH